MRNILLTLLVLFVLFVVYSIGVKRGSDGLGVGGGDKIAVLNVEGPIIDPIEHLESLDRIRKNEAIKALVVRINSPGGAVGPSQEIYSEIGSIKGEIPVVASMGAVAASGGYYIACAADTIFANPGTITGSIGVVAQFLNYKHLLKWAKIDVEVIKSGDFKDVGSPLRTMKKEEIEYIQTLIDNVHDQFKNAVQTSRDIDKSGIERISDGKIFSGEQALELKLVDRIGNLSSAIRFAADKSGIVGEPQIINYPEKKSPLRELLFSKLNLTSRINGLASSGGFGLFYIVDIVH